MGNRLTSKPRIFLTVYCGLVLVGLALSLLDIFFPILTVCLPLFGHSACTSIGAYLLILSNLPGYIVSALVLPTANTIPELYSILFVGGISIGFYYFLGKLFENKKEKPIPLKKWIIFITIGSTLLLLLLFAYLLVRVKM
jgi:hypothetical protein